MALLTCAVHACLRGDTTNYICILLNFPNPSHLVASGRDFQDIIRETCLPTSSLSTVLTTVQRKVEKIAQEIRLCSVLIQQLVKYCVTKLDPDNYIQARYGNPDVQILGTLKIKFQIYRFLNIPSKNMGSDLIFRVAISLEMAKLALLWQP